MTDEVIESFDSVIIFEICDQAIFIICSLKVEGIKFHGFSIKRTGFKSNFSAAGQNSLPPSKVQKRPPGIGLREHAMTIIENKKMKLLTKKQQESYKNAKSCHICTENFKNKYLKDKRYHKIRDHYHYETEYR